jgi:hypothetical protein
MGRSRYRFGEAGFPHFLTCTIVGWLPVFTRPETVQIVLDSWQFLQDEDRLVGWRRRGASRTAFPRGAWERVVPANVRSANRNRNAPSNRNTNNGFRPASTWRQDVHPVPPEFESVLLSRRVQPSPGRRPVPGDLRRPDE